MPVRLELMQGEITDAVLDALEETNDGVRFEETTGGMVLITAPHNLSLSRTALAEAAGYDVPVDELNEVTVAIVGHTRYWGPDGFEITED